MPHTHAARRARLPTVDVEPGKSYALGARQTRSRVGGTDERAFCAKGGAEEGLAAYRGCFSKAPRLAGRGRGLRRAKIPGDAAASGLLLRPQELLHARRTRRRDLEPRGPQARRRRLNRNGRPREVLLYGRTPRLHGAPARAPSK